MLATLNYKVGVLLFCSAVILLLPQACSQLNTSMAIFSFFPFRAVDYERGTLCYLKNIPPCVHARHGGKGVIVPGSNTRPLIK